MPDKIGKVPGLVKAFEEFALFCKNKWRASLLALIFLALLGGIFLTIYYGYKKIELMELELTKGVEILEESHTTSDELQTDFQESVEENILIESEMTKCVFKHDADAMVVFKFHNSRTDLQGKHDFFYSAVNEVSQKGIISYLPEVQQIPIVRLGKYITPMINGMCQVVDVADMAENDWLRGKLELQGINRIITCPIFDAKGNLLGFNELIYANGGKIPEGEALDEIIKCFKETTEHISLIMRN